jgi:chaperone modulatory protein CbpM
MGEPIYAGDIVVETQTYSLLQVCTICGVQTERVVELVSFGIIEPDGAQPDTWQFSESAVHRAKKALRLHRDLGLDHQGLALALELLDEIDRLRMIIARQQG